MNLKQLLRGLEGFTVRGSRDLEITGICADSRTAAPGNLFIARKGERSDGSQFIASALAAGASAILTDIYNPFIQAPQIICPNPAQMEAKLAARFYGKPANELFLVGITGTKGKTTTSYVARHLLEGLGSKCGLLGTVETIVGERTIRSQLTTHDAITNQRLLREMVSSGCKAAVLEVSSHGLEQGRVDEIVFDAAIFTNLTPDHLDYHKTMERYAAAKAKLFTSLRGAAIVNSDSPWACAMQGGTKRITYGIQQSSDIQAIHIRSTDQGTEFRVGAVLFTTPLMGQFNVYNLLAAIALGQQIGVPLPQIASILSTFQTVPGRLEKVANPLGIHVFVDYAHTGESLENVLTTLRAITAKRILLVFGCGGDRDPQRRRSMGEAAEKGADIAIITTDNPRKENPEEIAKQILQGFHSPEKAHLEQDRARAIHRAVALAQPGDILLIAGKGHEKVQIFAHQTVPFDDAAVAKEALQIRASSAMLSIS